MRIGGINRARFHFEAPDKSLYATEPYDVEIDIPQTYPEKPLECYLIQKIYHLNVEQSKEDKPRYQVLIKSISPNHSTKNLMSVF